MENYLAKTSIICIILFIDLLMINAQTKNTTNRFLLTSYDYKSDCSLLEAEFELNYCGNYFQGSNPKRQCPSHNQPLIKYDDVSGHFGYFLLMSKKDVQEVGLLTKLIYALNQLKSKDIFHKELFEGLDKNNSARHLIIPKPQNLAYSFTVFFESFIYIRNSSIAYHNTMLYFSFNY